VSTLPALIIGGGISGIACADTLTRNGLGHFRLVSPELGGRICMSVDGKVSYGAYYVRGDYRHILPRVHRSRRLRPTQIGVLRGGTLRRLHLSAIRHPVAFARLLSHVYRYDHQYQRFQRACLSMSQREYIENDPFASRLYRMDAVDYLREAKLTCLERGLVNPIVWGTALVDIREISASTMLFLLLILIHRTWEFEFRPAEIVEHFQDSLVVDAAKRVNRRADHWEVVTTGGRLYATRQVVMALPAGHAMKLLHRSCELNAPVTAHMIHVQGKVKRNLSSARYIILAPDARDIVMAHQKDGSWIIYSRFPNIDPSDYFHDWQLLGSKSWRPAFYVGRTLLDCRLDTGLYLVGDHNAVNMEDAWITGEYAAHQILKAQLK
jgi:glycine/D-amino acid oxidase-like deaminating enzyme